jgi:hypothetical protein
MTSNWSEKMQDTDDIAGTNAVLTRERDQTPFVKDDLIGVLDWHHWAGTTGHSYTRAIRRQNSQRAGSDAGLT